MELEALYAKVIQASTTRVLPFLSEAPPPLLFDLYSIILDYGFPMSVDDNQDLEELLFCYVFGSATPLRNGISAQFALSKSPDYFCDDEGDELVMAPDINKCHRITCWDTSRCICGRPLLPTRVTTRNDD